MKDPNVVRIILEIDFEDNEYFEDNEDNEYFEDNEDNEYDILCTYIASKYKSNQISLIGYCGLCKTIKWKDWQKFTANDIESCIKELITITEKEDFEV